MEAVSVTHLALALAAGSLTTLSPCVFPVLPLVVGGALSFALLGALVGWAGPALGVDGDSVRSVGGALLLVLGMAILMGWDKQLEAAIVPLLPGTWVQLTVGI